MDVLAKNDRSTIPAKETEKTKKVKRPHATIATKVEKLMNLDKVTLERLEKKKKEQDARRIKKKLQQVAEKNETLAQALTDKNQEINDLKRSVQSLNDVLNSVPLEELRCNSSIASSKIIELSKKNRQLRAELETTKIRVSKKDIEIQKLERDLKKNVDAKLEAALGRKASTASADDVQTKLNGLQQKLFESRNKNAELQNQLKLAQKCLQQEVGENFNLHMLASHPTQSNWRGRAQNILHLQQKVQELKERLDIYEQNSCGASSRVSSYSCPVDMTASQMSDIQSMVSSQGMLSGRMPSIANGPAAGKKNEKVGGAPAAVPFDRFKPAVRKSEIIHRAKVESLEKEIEALNVQLDEHRGKVLALKVRNKTLNDELLKHKMRASTLEEQTDYNGLNLATMNEKMNMQKYQFENRLEEFYQKFTETERQRDEAQYKYEELHSKLENMEELLNGKDNYIMQQNAMIRKLEDDIKALVGDFLFSCRELRKEEFMSILDSLETEKNRLLEHNQSLTQRLADERKRYETTSEQAAKMKVKISRQESKIRELEKEAEALNERKKRTQRMSEYANSLTASGAPHAVGTFVFENTSMVSLNENNNADPNAGGGGGDTLTTAHAMEFKHQLEYATEKITLLEEKIAHLAAEKEIDAKTFHDIITNTKHIILDTIMSNKSEHN